MTIKQLLLNAINKTPAASAWARGVRAAACDIIESLDESRLAGLDLDSGTMRQILLNGAQDWDSYSWGGSALIYDCDIARRFCAPAELKKKKGGELAPNSSEQWLDVQARALWQAEHLIKEQIKKLGFVLD